jgi:hypothetical protein
VQVFSLVLTVVKVIGELFKTEAGGLQGFKRVVENYSVVGLEEDSTALAKKGLVYLKVFRCIRYRKLRS